MARRQSDAARAVCALAMILFMIGIFVYRFQTATIRSVSVDVFSAASDHGRGGECCRGADHLELWGDAVKWGADFKVNSTRECCLACKAMCGGGNGRCLCDTWVFCGDAAACGSRFGECWLKKQKDTLSPERRESGDHVMWTSGLVFTRTQGIVGLETQYGLFRIELFPACAPHSVNYILELIASRQCLDCQFYRAETRGSFWFSNGDHVENAPYGPPFGVIQGTLKAHGTIFNKIPKEECPTIRRGSVAWIASGPEFFISLANHNEWRKPYTVFGSVLPEDMEIVDKIAKLPTNSEVWHNINVSVLEKPIPLRFKRMKTK